MMKTTGLIEIFLISTFLIFSVFGGVFAQMQMPTQAGSLTCEQCGMTVDSVSQAHFKVVDSNGARHYVECLKCAFKLLAKYGELTITTDCDWYGPNCPIVITLNYNMNMVSVDTMNAVFIDGNCMTNRIVYNETAASALMENNGLSPYLAEIQNATVPNNSERMSLYQAANEYAFAAGPTNSPASMTTSAPISTPLVVSTKHCEACGMDVTPADQSKYNTVDGNGTEHYAECFMCALRLLNKFEKINITTYCDWYGPNYPITVQSYQYGKEVIVAPSTAMFLNGGSCVTNRVAYNQTAADGLLANGFSVINTLPEQQYVLPENTNATLVKDAATSFAKSNSADSQTLSLLAIATVGGVLLVIVAVVAYKKMKKM
jgi:hypothetical protein